MHIPTHRVTRRRCHTQGQGGVAVTHTEKVTIACIHEHSNCTPPHITKDPVTHRHTRARMSPVTQASTPAVTVAVTQSNAKVVTHQHMYTQLSNKYFPGLLWISEVLCTTKPLLPRKWNLCEKTFPHNGARHAFVIMFSVACHPTLLDSELETGQDHSKSAGSHPEPSTGSAL